MKKIFLDYLKKELGKQQSLISRNALSDEDKATLNETIEMLKSKITEVEALEETKTAEETLKTFKDEIESKITAITEKLENSKKGPATSSDYLKTENAVRDFCAAIRNAKEDSALFHSEWNKKLSANGITIAAADQEVILPAAVKSIITDAWEAPGNWLNDLTSTGAKRFIARYNSSVQSSETSRAKGHTAGTTKVAQTITLKQKEINAQFIYKMLDISRQTEWMDDGSLIRYVATELVNQIKWEIEKAILVGDGRAAGNTKITSIEAIVRAASDDFVTKVTPNANATLVENLVTLTENVKGDRSKIAIFLNRKKANELRKVVFSASATPQYIALADMAEQIGVGKIVETEHLTDNQMIAVDLSAIVTVGSISPMFANWEDYMTNTLYWRYECAFGAAPARPKCAAFADTTSQSQS